MGSTELRIGNLVTLDENQRRDLWYNQINAINDFFEVKTIYSDGDIALQLDDEIVDINVDDVSPISLTEEWLLKFGFEICGYGEVHSMCFTGYRVKNSIWDVYAVSNGEFVLHKNTKETSITNIKYVHQLQNLYFSLTGEELIYQKI